MAEKKLYSLKRIVVLSVSIILLLFIIVSMLLSRTVMSEMLLRSETEYLEKQVETVQGFLDSALQNAFFMAYDIGVWDETVYFLKGENPDHIANTWSDLSLLETYQFNFIVIKDADGNDFYVDFMDYLTGEPLQIPDGFTDMLKPSTQQVMDYYQDTLPTMDEIVVPGQGGIFYYAGVPYLLASQPVMLTDNSEQPIGTVTVGNILNNEYFQGMTHSKNVNFQVLRVEAANLGDYEFDRENNGMVFTTLPLTDINGKYVQLVMSDDRVIYNEGQSWITLLITLLVTFSVAVFLLIYLLLDRLILHPLGRLNREINTLGKDARIDVGSYRQNQELHGLGLSINSMLDSLAQFDSTLAVLKSILNGMDAYICVSDPQTGEIAFANDKLLQLYHTAGEAELAQILQPQHSFPLAQLTAGPELVIVSEARGAQNQAYFRHTDLLIQWSEGKQMHLRHSVDISSLKQAEEKLQKRLGQEELMSAISQQFISPGETDQLIQQALQMAGEFMQVSTIIIADLDKAKENLKYHYGWRKDVDIAQPVLARTMPFQPGQVAYDSFVTKQLPYVACDSIDKAADYAFFGGMDIQAFMMTPIYLSGRLNGVLVFDHCEEVHHWEESDILLAQMISSLISSVITRNATEEQLTLLSSIVNSSSQYISYLNADGEYEYVNPGACQITGYSEAEIIAGGLSLLYSEEVCKFITETAMPAIKEQGNYMVELPILCKNGETRLLTLYICLVGKQQGQAVIGVDVTEKRQLEKDLIAAKELAEQSSQAKGDFLARMSHEMRTPMNAIIGMTGIAKSATDMEKKDYCLNKIDEASNHLLGVINDILDMSKIEANKFELSEAEFDIEKMLMRVANVNTFRVDEKQQNFVIQVDPGLPRFVIGDEQRIAQVVTNLLSNAIKFTPEQGDITLSVTRQSDAGKMVTILFQVRDSGIGISPEDQGKLFRSFEQADGSISRKFGGTGLGLAISKNIVQLMGGDIWLESALGQGSTFSFTIEVERSGLSYQGLLPPESTWEDLQLLLVDDSADVREYFMHLADSMHLHCDVAADGFEACRLIEQEQKKYNLFFVDWRMPGMDGIALTKRIKQMYEDDPVVIMISAAEWDNIQTEANAAGVNKFIAKPLFPSTVLDCINQCLGLREDLRETSAEEEPDYTGMFQGQRILLAEDVEINREIVAATLEYTGIEIEYAENGLQAFTMFQQNPDRYQLIFMDIHMPEMDGYEATQKIRALPMAEAQEVPIIAMTANVFREDIEKCLASGMNDHVGKPLDLAEVLDRLKCYLPYQA